MGVSRRRGWSSWGWRSSFTVGCGCSSSSSVCRVWLCDYFIFVYNMSSERARSAVSVALVSDFFYPSLGGVEMQIKELSGFLLGRVKRVIVVTHCYPGHVGVQ